MITNISAAGRTLRFVDVDATNIHPNELVISAGDATENRGQLPLWSQISRSDASRILWVKQIDRERIEVSGAHPTTAVALTDESALSSVLASRRVLLDVSGFQHNVWAPILRNLRSRKVATRILYAEPASYREHPSPSSPSLFDLSLTFEGLRPLPGFARLSGPVDENKCVFVAMLGFEGSRPQSLLSQLDPTPRVIPIVGVPGFQIEYPAYTVTCNRAFLDEARAHTEIRLARASCPFEAFNALSEIRVDYKHHYMYLAPVGTKPHAVGVVLFALANSLDTEIMFDHPVRRPGRTTGVGVIHVYDLGAWNDF